MAVLPYVRNWQTFEKFDIWRWQHKPRSVIFTERRFHSMKRSNHWVLLSGLLLNTINYSLNEDSALRVTSRQAENRTADTLSVDWIQLFTHSQIAKSGEKEMEIWWTSLFTTPTNTNVFNGTNHMRAHASYWHFTSLFYRLYKKK